MYLYYLIIHNAQGSNRSASGARATAQESARCFEPAGKLRLPGKRPTKCELFIVEAFCRRLGQYGSNRVFSYFSVGQMLNVEKARLDRVIGTKLQPIMRALAPASRGF